jgi:ABC-type branched-subunit amino acid transport system ATPase component
LLGGYRQRSRNRVRELLAECYELFDVLRERRDGPAGLLSGGEQQMLAYGRAVIADPIVAEAFLGLREHADEAEQRLEAGSASVST